MEWWFGVDKSTDVQEIAANDESDDHDQVEKITAKEATEIFNKALQWDGGTMKEK